MVERGLWAFFEKPQVLSTGFELSSAQWDCLRIKTPVILGFFWPCSENRKGAANFPEDKLAEDGKVVFRLHGPDQFANNAFIIKDRILCV